MTRVVQEERGSWKALRSSCLCYTAASGRSRIRAGSRRTTTIDNWNTRSTRTTSNSHCPDHRSAMKHLNHGRWKCLKVGGASNGRGHGERVQREPITGVWEQSPQRGPGAEPLVEGQGGKAPLKLKAFWFLNVPRCGKTLRWLSRFDSV